MKKLYFIFGFVLFCIFLNAQSPYYYYYEGEKQYLSLNTEYAFLSLKEDKVPANILQRKIEMTELQSDKSNKKQFEEKEGPERFWTELNFNETLSDKEYLSTLSEIKQLNEDVIISPYFKFVDDDKVGLSNFFYVKLKSESDVTLLKEMAVKTQSVIIEQDEFMPLWFVLSITERSVCNALETANLFYESEVFQAAEPNFMVDVMQCVNDTYWEQQWGLSNTGQYGGTTNVDIKACGAWQISKGNNVTVAVIDQGIELNHPDLAANLHTGSYDTENRTSPSIVRGEHGTACAGIIGAVQNNKIGISGVAPNCRLMSISNSLSFGQLNIQQNLAAGINWAWQSGASVISNSWGDNALQGTYITDAINNAVTQGRNGLGCVIVFASGNNNASTVNYPASLSNVIAVGAISPCGQRKSPSSCDGENWGSNYGSALDVVAPGVLISTTDIRGNAGYNPNFPIHTLSGGNKITSDYSNKDYTVWFNGTSAATPHVAGIAALILSIRPDLTQAQVRQAIESTCTRLDGYIYMIGMVDPRPPWTAEVGYGLVNAYEAVSSVEMKISGPSLVCNQATYTISNFPTGATVNWRVANGLRIVSGQGTSQVVVSKLSSNMDGTVYADIANNNYTLTLSKPGIQVGTKTPSIQVGNSNGLFIAPPYYAGTNYHISAYLPEAAGDPATNFRWTIVPPSGSDLFNYLYIGYSFPFTPPIEGNYTFELKYYNAAQCGWSDVVSKTYYFYPSLYSYLVYPNPAGDIVTIEQEEDGIGNRSAPPTYSIQLWSETLGLVRTVDNATQVQQVSLQGLAPGTYYVHIIVDGQTVSKQTLVKK